MKSEIEDLSLKVRLYQKTFVEVCGDQRKIQSPNVGTKIRKLHSLIHFSDSIELFGSAQNFFGGYPESNMKTFVKQPSKCTRKWKGESFLIDSSKRWSELQLINSYHTSRFPCDKEFSSVDKQKVENLNYVGSNRLKPEFQHMAKKIVNMSKVMLVEL